MDSLGPRYKGIPPVGGIPGIEKRLPGSRETEIVVAVVIPVVVDVETLGVEVADVHTIAVRVANIARSHPCHRTARVTARRTMPISS